MQVFLAEAQAVLRAHVLSLGGNALVSYQLNELILLDNPHKHQVNTLCLFATDTIRVCELTCEAGILKVSRPLYTCRAFFNIMFFF